MAGYSELKRVNDYVGSGIYAEVTWVSECPSGSSHVFGLLSHRCLRCQSSPTLRYCEAPHYYGDTQYKASRLVESTQEGR